MIQFIVSRLIVCVGHTDLWAPAQQKATFDQPQSSALCVCVDGKLSVSASSDWMLWCYERNFLLNVISEMLRLISANRANGAKNSIPLNLIRFISMRWIHSKFGSFEWKNFFAWLTFHPVQSCKCTLTYIVCSRLWIQRNVSSVLKLAKCVHMTPR